VRYAKWVRLYLPLILTLCFSLTYEARSAKGDRLVASEPMRVCLVPLGKYDKGLLKSAIRGAEYLYGAEVSILGKQKLPRAAYYKPRRRYRAEKLLDFLSAEIVPESGCDVVMGFTAVDISTTKDHHVDWGILGLGEIGGTVGVVSSYRMRRKANRTKQKRRVVSTTNHELGHVLGAPHGGAPGCLMNDAQGTIRTVDAEHGLLCEESRALIEAHTGRSLPVISDFDWSTVLAP
jgi:archaemetzincin